MEIKHQCKGVADCRIRETSSSSQTTIWVHTRILLQRSFVLLLALHLGTCTESDSPPVVPGEEGAAATPVFELQNVAWALAIALGDGRIRQSLSEVLVDARAPGERQIAIVGDLHYLRPPFESALIRTGMDRERVSGLWSHIEDYHLWLPNILDRMSGPLQQDAIVLPFVFDFEGPADSVFWGFRIGGDSASVPLEGTIPEVVIALAPPLSISSGLRVEPPETKGTEAVPREPERRTASTAVRPDFITWSFDRDCRIRKRSDSADADRDGLRDKCEYLVAKAFRPMLMINDEENAREPYWAVRPAGERHLQAFYALAYHKDTRYPKHDGDSEFIVVNIRLVNARQLKTEGVTLSAHHGSKIPYADRSVLDEPLMVWRDNVRPVVWVADGKHANYVSEKACEKRHAVIFKDDCTVKDSADVVILRDANLGGGGMPLINCVRSLDPQLTEVECFWNMYREFRGWQTTKTSATGYGSILPKFRFYPTRVDSVEAASRSR